MKKKWHLYVLIAVLCICAIVGCVLLYHYLYNCVRDFFQNDTPDHYPFENKNEPIESIELLYYPRYDDNTKPVGVYECIRTLSSDEIPEFMNAVYKLETAKRNPPCGCGPYLARVKYKNGSIECYGFHAITFSKSSRNTDKIGFYYFSGDAFEELFMEYANK